MKNNFFGSFKNKKKAFLAAVAALSILPWFAQATDVLDIHLDNSPPRVSSIVAPSGAASNTFTQQIWDKGVKLGSFVTQSVVGEFFKSHVGNRTAYKETDFAKEQKANRTGVVLLKDAGKTFSRDFSYNDFLDVLGVDMVRILSGKGAQVFQDYTKTFWGMTAKNFSKLLTNSAVNYLKSGE